MDLEKGRLKFIIHGHEMVKKKPKENKKNTINMAMVVVITILFLRTLY